MMAEFKVVMKHIQRFCGSQINCESCPVWNREDMHCKVEHAFHDGELSDDLPEIERIVMGWAEKHPEPRYPSWVEWQKANFPASGNLICPAVYMPKSYCEGNCTACRKKPIPADIAEKLRIKPIGEEE